MIVCRFQRNCRHVCRPFRLELIKVSQYLDEIFSILLLSRYSCNKAASIQRFIRVLVCKGYEVVVILCTAKKWHSKVKRVRTNIWHLTCKVILNVLYGTTRLFMCIQTMSGSIIVSVEAAQRSLLYMSVAEITRCLKLVCRRM